MTSIAGTRLGPYEILSALGAGGMGEVYRARDTKLGRDVALKILPDAFACDRDRLARFQREAHVLASLNHPHIAAIYGLEDAEGVTALVMELVEGEDLSQRIARGAIPIDEALPIAKQIAEALEAAHEQGIIHRDLKPANIKVRSDGTVKVLDFGLAKAMEPAAGSSPNVTQSPTITTPAITHAGMILGTAAYMSPEQAKGRAADKRGDIWAFGVVVFEMLTGQRPFTGETISDTLASVLKTDPDWRALPAATPPNLRRLLRSCLNRDPRQRLQAIGDARVQVEDVLAGAPDDSSAAAMAGAAGPRKTHERVAWSVAAVMAVLLIAAGIAMVALRLPAPELPLTRLELVTPPTTDPFSFALSPDGRQIVYVATTEGASKLWLRSLDQTDAQPLAGTEGATAPFWAPDGRALGFFADSKLKRIDVGGGAPQVLADAPIPRGGTWNRDGVIVFAGAGSGLSRVAAAGASATELTRLVRGQNGQWLPQFLPDGQRFLFFHTPDAQGVYAQGVYIGSLEGGEPTRVLAADSAAAYAAPGYLLLVSQGDLVARRFEAGHGVVSGDPLPVAPAVGVDAGNFRGAFAVSAAGVLAHRGGVAGRRQLVWVDRAGQPRGVLLSPEDAALASVELSPNERQIAVMRVVQGNPDVWLLEVARALVSRFTSEPGNDSMPIWSPDGSRLVFRSNGGGKFDLFEKPTNGGADEQRILVTPQDKAPQAWSPDGRFLLYAVQDLKTQSDLWALPLVGERKPFPVAEKNFDEVQGQFSPDSQWVAYASNETGHYEVYVQSFPVARGKLRVSTGGGITPRWRRDGKELFYVGPDNRMMAAPIRAASDGRTLSPGAPVALFDTRLTSGNTGTGGYASRAQYAVASDGRFLLNVSADDADASPITIVQNWPAALKK